MWNFQIEYTWDTILSLPLRLHQKFGQLSSPEVEHGGKVNKDEIKEHQVEIKKHKGEIEHHQNEIKERQFFCIASVNCSGPGPTVPTTTATTTITTSTTTTTTATTTTTTTTTTPAGVSKYKTHLRYNQSFERQSNDSDLDFTTS